MAGRSTPSGDPGARHLTPPGPPVIRNHRLLILNPRGGFPTGSRRIRSDGEQGILGSGQTDYRRRAGMMSPRTDSIRRRAGDSPRRVSQIPSGDPGAYPTRPVGFLRVAVGFDPTAGRHDGHLGRIPSDGGQAILDSGHTDFRRRAGMMITSDGFDPTAVRRFSVAGIPNSDGGRPLLIPER